MPIPAPLHVARLVSFPDPATQLHQHIIAVVVDLTQYRGMHAMITSFFLFVHLWRKQLMRMRTQVYAHAHTAVCACAQIGFFNFLPANFWIHVNVQCNNIMFCSLALTHIISVRYNNKN